MKLYRTLVSGCLLIGIALSAAAAPPPPVTSLTIYPSGAAVVSQTRTMNLVAGRQTLRLPRMPQSLDLQSLWLSGAGVRLLGSGLQPPANRAQVLRELVGGTVTLRRCDGNGGDVTRDAQLLAVDDVPVVRIDGRIEWLDAGSPWRLALTKLPPEPSLVGERILYLDAEEAGPQPVTMTFQVGGLEWGASYVAQLDQEQKTLALRASAAIHNAGDVDWEDARVSLIAGEVSRAGGGPRPMRGMARVAAFESAPAAPAFAYYRYTLDEPITLAAGEVRNVTLFREVAIAVALEYRIEDHGWGYTGGEQRTHAQIHLQFENQLGKPLPAGSVSVYGGGDRPLLLGEDAISDTPAGGTVELVLGKAFDITAQRTTTEIDREGDAREVTQRVVVQNAKDGAVTVRVIASLPGDWKVLEESRDHERLDAQRVAWQLPVPASGETTLTYRFRYH